MCGSRARVLVQLMVESTAKVQKMMAALTAGSGRLAEQEASEAVVMMSACLEQMRVASNGFCWLRSATLSTKSAFAEQEVRHDD